MIENFFQIGNEYKIYLYFCMTLILQQNLLKKGLCTELFCEP